MLLAVERKVLPGRDMPMTLRSWQHERIVRGIMPVMYLDFWKCQNADCNKRYCSLHSMFGLLEQHQAATAADLSEVGFLCRACSQVTARDRRIPVHIPNRSDRLESSPAEKVFAIALKCADTHCESLIPILAATGSSTREGDFAMWPKAWTFVGDIRCRDGHPPELPQKLLSERLLWSDPRP
jgi:hypothetical protein